MTKLLVGEYVQFSGNSKVYKVTKKNPTTGEEIVFPEWPKDKTSEWMWDPITVDTHTTYIYLPPEYEDRLSKDTKNVERRKRYKEARQRERGKKAVENVRRKMRDEGTAPKPDAMTPRKVVRAPKE